MNRNNQLYNAERIIACLNLLLTIMDFYEIEYTMYREDDYINIINQTISLYDDMDDLKHVTVEVLEFNIDDYDIWCSMLSFFANYLKDKDLSDEFPIYNDDNEEIIFNWKDALDILDYLSNISREDIDA